jgi:hypothetical protein
VRRYEWKYCVPEERVAELSAALAPRTRPDAYGRGPEGAYYVRNLYFDTPDLRFYHEKKDGLRIRRKLRVRNYGNGQYFLEIKRKVDKIVVKERVQVQGSQLAGAFGRADPAVMMAGRPVSDVRALERFRFNVKSLGLVPTLLIGYERRAMIGQAEPGLRITLDRDLRGRAAPGPDLVFEDGGLVAFEPRHLLELKFAGRPPRWLMDIVAKFHLRRDPYSKYCEGIDRCASRVTEPGADGPGEVPKP